MRTGKSTGIHFLKDQQIAEKIVSLVNTQNRDVLEIGPGMGSLTSHIRNYKNLYLIEREQSFENELRRKFPNAHIIIADALEIEWPHFDVFISNMPYMITSPLLERLWVHNFEEAVITIQKEVADRMVAKPHSKDYSKLSIMMQLKYEIDIKFEISPSKFYPPPRVKSTVLTLKKKDVKIDENFSDFLRVLFSQRRKKIKNIINTKNFGDLRPEDLTVEEIILLYNSSGTL